MGSKDWSVLPYSTGAQRRGEGRDCVARWECGEQQSGWHHPRVEEEEEETSGALSSGKRYRLYMIHRVRGEVQSYKRRGDREC